MATLINTTELRVLYNEAESGKHEAYSTRFFNYFFQKVVFRDEPTFWISSEQPPTDDTSDRRRVDLVVNYFDQGYTARVLCFTEAKRGQSHGKAIEVNEEQLMHAASTYCEAFELPYVHVMSTYGAKARFFSYRLEEDSFQMMLAGDNALNVADKSEYLDPDTPKGASYWTRAFERMKRYPPTPVAGKQDAQPQWLQPNVGARVGPTPVVSSSDKETSALRQEVDSSGRALIRTHGVQLCIQKDTHFRLNGGYFEWTGGRMYQHDTPRPHVEIKVYDQGHQYPSQQLHEGVWWKLVNGKWVKV